MADRSLASSSYMANSHRDSLAIRHPADRRPEQFVDMDVSVVAAVEEVVLALVLVVVVIAFAVVGAHKLPPAVVRALVAAAAAAAVAGPVRCLGAGQVRGRGISLAYPLW